MQVCAKTVTVNVNIRRSSCRRDFLPFSTDCESAHLDISGASSLETSMTRLIDPPPPSPASSHATSPVPQIEVPILMKSLRELKLVETPSPPVSEDRKRVSESEGEGLPGPQLQAKSASGSNSEPVIQMLNLVHTTGLSLQSFLIAFHSLILPRFIAQTMKMESGRRWPRS